MKRTINEVYEEIKQLRDGLEVYIKTNNKKNPTAKIVLINDLNIYNDILNQLDGVLEELAEKDKEIEEYKNYFKSFGCKDFAEFQELIGLTKISANDKERDDIIRKQVCDEIRDFMNTYDALDPTRLLVMDLLRKLDQIEKGSDNE